MQNKVTKYQGPNVRTGGTFIVQEGQPINSIYGYKALGIFRSADDISKAPVHYVVPGNANVSTSPGDIRYADLDSNNKITPNDQTVIGNIIPRYTYGINLSVQGYGFDLSVLFNGVAKQDALTTGQYFQWSPEGSSGRNINASWLNHWTSQNPNAPMPRLIYNYSHNNDVSSFWVQNASYLRLRNIQLTYTVPAAVAKRVGMGALRIYVNAQNPVTWTKFTGTDPEQPATNTTIGFPNVKVYTVGLNANF